MRFLLRFLLLLLILLFGFAVIGIYWTFYKPLPDYSATLSLQGLNNAVEVHWDPYGVPYIYAGNEEDLYFSIGYIHAQERLWQMTLSQISAEGRFAEHFGEELIPFDRHQRTLGLWETAKKIEAEAPDSLLHFLQKYSDGVNRFVEENTRNLPIEFTLLDIKPLEWTPAHSIAMSRLMAWDQNMHWWSELAYAHLAEKLDSQKMAELFPHYPDHYPTTLNDSQSRSFASAVLPVLDKEMKLRSILSKKGSPFGSNAWAVNGSKTESGMPILAGDPHMGLSIPGFWYEVHYSSPQQTISGATIPGAPFVVLGRNQHLAWSMTNMMADDTDFFVELSDPENPGRYITDSLSVPVTFSDFETREEIIRVKNGDDKLFRVRSTRNGPVISDIHSGQSLMEDKQVTLKWVGHNTSQELWALYKMNRAENINQFQDAVSRFRSPGMNFIYADKDDNIALFSGASIPLRDENPLYFRKGWDPSYQWNGTIPFDRLPHVVNPESGFVAHANNKMHTDSYPYYIASFWEPPSRIMRINQLLEMNDSLNTEWMQMIQFDAFSEHAQEVTDLILPILRAGNQNGQFDDALSYIGNWDFKYLPASVAASIFDLFFMNLSKNILEDELGEEAYHLLTSLEHLPVVIVTRLLREENSFLNPAVNDVGSRNEIVQRSMEETLGQLRDKFGPEPIEWRWENLNTLTLRPPLLGEVSDDPDAPAVFRMIVNNLFSKGPYPVHGHGMSVNKGQYSWHQPFKMNLGASVRRIIDFSSPGRSLSVLPTGQSGNPISAHYGDQTNLWLEGRYRYIYQDSTFFQQTSYQTTTFLPGE